MCHISIQNIIQTQFNEFRDNNFKNICHVYLKNVTGNSESCAITSLKDIYQNNIISILCKSCCFENNQINQSV